MTTRVYFKRDYPAQPAPTQYYAGQIVDLDDALANTIIAQYFGEVYSFNSNYPQPYEWIGSGASNMKVGMPDGTTVSVGMGALTNLNIVNGIVRPDFSVAGGFNLTATSNFTLAYPSNFTDFNALKSGSIFITQDSVGSRLITFGAGYTSVSGLSNITLSTAPFSLDRIDYKTDAAGNLALTITKDIKSEKLRIVTLQNCIARNSDTTGLTGKYDRWPHDLGNFPVKSLVFSMSNVIGGGNSDQIVNNNAFTLVDMAVEFNGVSVPVSFGGVSSNITVASGVIDFKSDPIPASAFGLAEIPENSQFWTKTRILLAQGTDRVPFASGRNVGQLTGTQTAFYNPAVTTVSASNTVGPFTTTGTAPTARINGFAPYVLGTFSLSVVKEPKIIYASGDSITEGIGDVNTLRYGFGWLQRTAFNLKTPSINFAVSGSKTILDLNNQALMTAYMKYANFGIIHKATNDFGNVGTGDTVLNVQNNVQSIRNLMYQNGITTVGVATIGPETTSTDNFTTYANQTTNAGWGAGGRPELYSQSLGGLNFDFVLDFNSVLKGPAPNDYKWLVAPNQDIARYSSQDGVHPSGFATNILYGGHYFMANLATTAFQKLSY